MGIMTRYLACSFVWCSFLLLSLHIDKANAVVEGWRMKDRFYGFRFVLDGVSDPEDIMYVVQQQADELAGFGWIQQVQSSNRLVGEFRGSKRTGTAMEKWLRDLEGQQASGVVVKLYEDTKIYFHPSHFRIFPPERDTCFPDEPHKCAEPLKPDTLNVMDDGFERSDPASRGEDNSQEL